jgi:hypothetical protein
MNSAERESNRAVVTRKHSTMAPRHIAVLAAGSFMALAAVLAIHSHYGRSFFH